MTRASLAPLFSAPLLACVLLAVTKAVAQVQDDVQICSEASGDVAIAACTRAITSGKYRNNVLARLFFNRGIEWVNKDEFNRAIADFDQTIQRSPNTAEAFLYRGISYRKKGQYDLAIADLDEAIRLVPDGLEIFNERGLAKLLKGDKPGGDADIARAQKLQPGIGQK